MADRPCRHLRVITYSIAFIAVLALGFALHVAQPLLLPIVYAFILSMLLRPAAEWLDRLGIPEGASGAALTGFVILTLFSGIYFAGRPAVAWFDRLPETLSEAREKLDGIEKAFTRVNEVTQSVEEITAPANGDKNAPVMVQEKSLAMSVASSAQTIFIQFMLMAVVLYFLLATRRSSRRKFLALRSSFRTRRQSARILTAIDRNIVGYVLTMLAINLWLGVAVGAAIALIGGPSPVVFGVIAGILNFVPYLGPTIVNILLAVTGLVQEDNLLRAFAPLGAYIVLNFIESNFVTPSLIGVRQRISPLAIILAIAIFTWLWGPGGSIVAIPIVVIVKTICDNVKSLSAIGILLSVSVESPKLSRLKRHAPAPAALHAR